MELGEPSQRSLVASPDVYPPLAPIKTVQHFILITPPEGAGRLVDRRGGGGAGGASSPLGWVRGGGGADRATIRSGWWRASPTLGWVKGGWWSRRSELCAWLGKEWMVESEPYAWLGKEWMVESEPYAWLGKEWMVESALSTTPWLGQGADGRRASPYRLAGLKERIGGERGPYALAWVRSGLVESEALRLELG